jgi:hypothetical protein
VANSAKVTVLCSDPKPLMAKVFCEQTRFWDRVWRFRGDSAGEDPGQTR